MTIAATAAHEPRGETGHSHDGDQAEQGGRLAAFVAGVTEGRQDRLEHGGQHHVESPHGRRPWLRVDTA